MTELYCVKCKKKNPTNDITNKTSKNGRNMISGLCSVCNTKCNQFIKSDKIKNNDDALAKLEHGLKPDAKGAPYGENINNDEIKIIKDDNIKNANIKKEIKIKKPRKTKDIVQLLNPTPIKVN